MINIVGYFKFMMNRSCSMRTAFWTSIITFALSIILTIADIILQCEYSVFFKPCSYLASDHPFQCQFNNVQYCCVNKVQRQCDEQMQCIIKPDKSIAVCSGMLISTWSIYLIFIISSFCFVAIYRRLSSHLEDDYIRMNQVNEISHVPSDAENVPSVNIYNDML